MCKSTHVSWSRLASRFFMQLLGVEFELESLELGVAN